MAPFANERFVMTAQPDPSLPSTYTVRDIERGWSIDGLDYRQAVNIADKLNDMAEQIVELEAAIDGYNAGIGD